MAQHSNPQVVFRNAKANDRLQLFAAMSHKIYNGHDYLPLWFEKWLHDKHHRMVVAVINDTVVALDTIGLFDQGRTVVLQALRVHPSFQGRGIASQLSAHIQKLVHEDVPSAKRMRAVIQHFHVASVRIHEKLGYRLVHKEAFGMAAILRKPTETPAEKLQLPAGVSIATAATVWERLQASPEATRAALMVGNMVVVDWMPHEMTAANFAFMENQLEMGFLVLETEGVLAGFAVCQRSIRCSGCHLFACVRVASDPDRFTALASAAFNLYHHGCSHFCLSYDQPLRDVIEPAAFEPDHRPVPALTTLAEQLPLDFSADYVGGSQAVYELGL